MCNGIGIPYRHRCNNTTLLEEKKFGSDRIRYLIDNRQFFDRAEICASGEKGGEGEGRGVECVIVLRYLPRLLFYVTGAMGCHV